MGMLNMKKVILSLVALFVFIAAGIYWYVSRFDFDRDPPVVVPDTLRATLSGLRASLSMCQAQQPEDLDQNQSETRTSRYQRQ